MLTPEEFNVILERVRNGTASADDLDRLGRSQPKTGETVNINIDELTGEDVHIGDRITIEQILGQKVIYVSVEEIKTREFHQTSPYKGLKKFEPEDKDRFFGRDQFIKDLANELEQTNLILLLGASGSGKSSVVRAGLLSWLSKKWGSRLVSLTFTPDQDPFESLYASLLRYYKQAEAQVAREGREDTLTQIVTTLRQRDAYWFIFIDQFEELFTTSQADKRDRFITGLAQLNTALKLLGSAQACPVKVMATMRADFLDRLSPYPALVKATNQHRPMIAEMQLDELRQAIEQPAAQHGVVFEMGLVEEIIKDVQGQAGYLPLLQYTLNLVWETEVQNGSIHDRTLNISTYRALGGVRGALQKHVSQIYEALPEAERLASQRVFLKLVEIGGDEESGTEWKPVRRRAARSEFDTELERRVLARLIDENLLVSDQQPQALASTVEIAHEALLTSWETLNTWIKENRQAIALRNRLNDDVARWQAKKSEDELWTGSKLEQVLELKKDPTFNQVMGGFSATANQFIDTSLGLRDRQLRRTRIIAGIGVTLAALAGVGATFAGYQLQQAARQRVEQYAANSESLLATNPTEALVYAISATGLSRSPFVKFPNYSVPSSVQKSLFRATLTSREENILQDAKAVISSDRQYIMTVNNDGKIQLHDWKGNATGTEIQIPKAKSYSFIPDSQTILSDNLDGIRVWNLKGELVESPLQHPPRMGISSFSPDGKYAIGFHNNAVATLWDIRGNSIGTSSQRTLGLYTLEGEGQGYHKFSNNGRLIIGGVFGQIKLWDIDGHSAEIPVPRNVGISSATISPDEKIIAAGSVDGKVRLQSLSQNLQSFDNEVNAIKGHTEDVTSIDFSLDGKRLVSGSQDGTVRLWSLESGRLILMSDPIQIRNTAVSSVQFSKDGNHLISFAGDNVVRIWDVKDDPTEEKLQRDYQHFEASRQQGITSLRAVSFSQDGEFIIAKYVGNWGGPTEGYLVWNLQGQTVDPTKLGITYDSGVSRVNPSLNLNEKIKFSPDGKKVVAITAERTIRLFRVDTQSWLQTACDRLRYHPVLAKPTTDIAREAKATCEQHVWRDNLTSEPPNPEISPPFKVQEPLNLETLSQAIASFAKSQTVSTSAKTTPAPTASPSPSPSTSSYKFEFPQASCGDPSAKPGSAFPVFIDHQPIEEIHKKYCADAYSVSKREKTGKPSVQVASFIDRQKAEAFAKEVGGEVGEP